MQDRNLDAEPIGASDEVAKDVVGLGRASVLDIVQHRRGGVGADLGVVAAVKLDDRGRRRVSLGGSAVVTLAVSSSAAATKAAPAGATAISPARARVSVEIAAAAAMPVNFAHISATMLSLIVA